MANPGLLSFMLAGKVLIHGRNVLKQEVKLSVSNIFLSVLKHL